MVDSLTKAQRSERMRRVKQLGTALELLVRRGLHRRGLRFRISDRTLPGSPDLVLPARKAVVFVHGCFWHAHDCRLGRRPSTNAKFWKHKALANRARDARKEAGLRERGWRVFVVWQCEVAAPSAAAELLDRLANALRSLPSTNASNTHTVLTSSTRKERDMPAKKAAPNPKTKRTAKPIRHRKAKADGSVGTLQRTLEKNFGLPTGSVRIVYPSGRKARVDADVGALRNHWAKRG